MKQQDLLDGIRNGRERLEPMWAGLSAAQITARPGPQADWSVKDLIAHLTYWEQITVDDIQLSLNGGTPAPGGDTDAVNAQVLAANFDRPLADVLADFERSRREFEALIAELSDDALNAPPPFVWEDDATLGALLASESYEHYEQHIPDLSAYIERVKGS